MARHLSRGPWQWPWAVLPAPSLTRPPPPPPLQPSPVPRPSALSTATFSKPRSGSVTRQPQALPAGPPSRSQQKSLRHAEAPRAHRPRGHPAVRRGLGHSCPSCLRDFRPRCIEVRLKRLLVQEAFPDRHQVRAKQTPLNSPSSYSLLDAKLILLARPGLGVSACSIVCFLCHTQLHEGRDFVLVAAAESSFPGMS